MIDELSLCSNLEYLPEKCIDKYFIYIWRSLVSYLNELQTQSSTIVPPKSTPWNTNNAGI